MGFGSLFTSKSSNSLDFSYVWHEGIQRVEQFMFHKDAFREILLNAIVHKDYSSCNPIQISVYEDKIYIWNYGIMQGV